MVECKKVKKSEERNEKRLIEVEKIDRRIDRRERDCERSLQRDNGGAFVALHGKVSSDT